MTFDDTPISAPDDLELLRQEARELGMPSEITPASVGIKLRTPQEILDSADGRARATSPVAGFSARASSRKKIAVRIIAAAAAIVAIGAVIFAPGQENHARATVPPILEYQFADMGTIANAPGVDARDALLKLSERAKTQREKVAVGTTQYRLTESWYASLEDGKPSELIPSRRDQWLRADGSMRIREAFGEPLNLDGRGLSITEKSEPVQVDDETYPADESGQDPQFVAKLSGDYRTVRQALVKQGGCDDKYVTRPIGQCIYFQMTDIFLTYVVPPRVAAAFWRILADEPSLRSLGTVKDRAGRPGIGISLITEDHPEYREVLIISPDTGQLLGSEEILIKDVPDISFKAPALMSFMSLLQSQFTTKDGPTN